MVKETHELRQKQIERIFRYLLRQTAVRDYIKLYPDMEPRFPVLIEALPDRFVEDIVQTLENIDAPLSDIQKLIDILSLTTAEARLSLNLHAGHGLDDIASMNGISRNTVRNQLQSVFEKTCTRRQPALIRRIADVLISE